MDMDDRWGRVSGNQFLNFDAVENKRSKRADLHAFLLLDELFPSSHNIVACAVHDEIFLAVDDHQVESLTDDQIVELSRCGVHYSESSLAMFT